MFSSFSPSFSLFPFWQKSIELPIRRQKNRLRREFKVQTVFDCTSSSPSASPESHWAFILESKLLDGSLLGAHCTVLSRHSARTCPCRDVCTQSSWHTNHVPLSLSPVSHPCRRFPVHACLNGQMHFAGPHLHRRLLFRAFPRSWERQANRCLPRNRTRATASMGTLIA